MSVDAAAVAAGLVEADVRAALQTALSDTVVKGAAKAMRDVVMRASGEDPFERVEALAWGAFRLSLIEALVPCVMAVASVELTRRAEAAELALQASELKLRVYENAGNVNQSLVDDIDRFHRQSQRAVDFASCTIRSAGAMVVMAEQLARHAHAGQTDRFTNAPYVLHLERVVEMLDGAEEMAVGWLHDVLEDTPTRAMELLRHGFSARIVAAVSLLTRPRAVSYEGYIQHLLDSGNDLAIAVKHADLLDHLRPQGPVLPERMVRKYAYALALVSERVHARSR